MIETHITQAIDKAGSIYTRYTFRFTGTKTSPVKDMGIKSLKVLGIQDKKVRLVLRIPKWLIPTLDTYRPENNSPQADVMVNFFTLSSQGDIEEHSTVKMYF